MRRFTNLILLAGTGLALAACAECPKTANDYNKPPYVPEGTAGEGVAVYNTSCPTVEHVAPVSTTTTTTPAPVAQPYEPVKVGEPVFSESQRK